jgi:hypothetical protein
VTRFGVLALVLAIVAAVWLALVGLVWLADWSRWEEEE